MENFSGFLGRSLKHLYRLLPSYRTPRQLKVNELFFEYSPVRADILKMLQQGFSGN